MKVMDNIIFGCLMGVLLYVAFALKIPKVEGKKRFKKCAACGRWRPVE
jgi:hypothetical protein